MSALVRPISAVPARAAAPTAAAGDRLRVVRDPLRIALFVLVVLTVSRVHQHYPLLAKLRPALLLVMASGAYAFLHPRYLTRQNVLRLWPMRCVLALGVIACGSAAFGISLGRAASFILDSYAKTIILAFLLAVSIRGVRDLYTLVWAYAVSCGILSFFSLFVFGLSRSNSSYVSRLSDLYTYDSNDLGVVVIVGLAFTLLLLVTAKGLPRFALLLNLAGIAATIARSGSRGAFIGLVVFGVAGLLLANGVSVGRRVGIVIAAALALGLGAPPGYWEQMQTVLAPSDDYNFSAKDGRKQLFERGIDYMSEYPVFGVGINNFQRAECTISTKAKQLAAGKGIRCAAPHNSYIQAGAETGIPGLLVFVGLVIGSIVAMLRLRAQLPRAWRRGTPAERFLHNATTFFALALLGFAVSAFFVSFAWMEILYIVVALMSGLYTSLLVQRSTGTTPAALTAPTGAVAGWRSERSEQRWRLGRGGAR